MDRAYQIHPTACCVIKAIMRNANAQWTVRQREPVPAPFNTYMCEMCMKNSCNFVCIYAMYIVRSPYPPS